MAHIVTANCNDCKYTDCCVVCPVECFYQDEMMLYIDPEDCIDCEACRQIASFFFAVEAAKLR